MTLKDKLKALKAGDYYLHTKPTDWAQWSDARKIIYIDRYKSWGRNHG